MFIQFLRKFAFEAVAPVTRVGMLMILAGFVPGDALSQQTGRLVGTVSDAQTGSPVAEATITVRGTGRRRQTDAQGRWVLTALALARLP